MCARSLSSNGIAMVDATFAGCAYLYPQLRPQSSGVTFDGTVRSHPDWRPQYVSRTTYVTLFDEEPFPAHKEAASPWGVSGFSSCLQAPGLRALDNDLNGLLGSSLCSLASSGLGVNDGLEFRPGGELGYGARGNFERSAGARILAGTGRALHRLESAEADQGNRVPFFDGNLNGFNEGIQDVASERFGEFVLGNKFFDEFSAIHF